MNESIYAYEVKFKNPNVAKEVYNRYANGYRARQLSPSTHARVSGSVMFLSEEAFSGLDAIVSKVSSKRDNIRYNAQPYTSK